MSTFKVGFAIHFNLDMANLSTPFKHSTICLISFVLTVFWRELQFSFDDKKQKIILFQSVLCIKLETLKQKPDSV